MLFFFLKKYMYIDQQIELVLSIQNINGVHASLLCRKNNYKYKESRNGYFLHIPSDYIMLIMDKKDYVVKTTIINYSTESVYGRSENYD